MPLPRCCRRVCAWRKLTQRKVARVALPHQTAATLGYSGRLRAHDNKHESDGDFSPRTPSAHRPHTVQSSPAASPFSKALAPSELALLTPTSRNIHKLLHIQNPAAAKAAAEAQEAQRKREADEEEERAFRRKEEQKLAEARRKDLEAAKKQLQAERAQRSSSVPPRKSKQIPTLGVVLFCSLVVVAVSTAHTRGNLRAATLILPTFLSSRNAAQRPAAAAPSAVRDTTSSAFLME